MNPKTEIVFTINTIRHRMVFTKISAGMYSTEKKGWFFF